MHRSRKYVTASIAFGLFLASFFLFRAVFTRGQEARTRDAEFSRSTWSRVVDVDKPAINAVTSAEETIIRWQLSKLTLAVRAAIVSITVTDDASLYPHRNTRAMCDYSRRIWIKHSSLVVYPFDVCHEAYHAYLIHLLDESDSGFRSCWSVIPLEPLTKYGKESMQEEVAEWGEHFQLAINGQSSVFDRLKASSPQITRSAYLEKARVLLTYGFVDEGQYERFRRFLTE